ncbi:MAG: LOG family protein [Pseudomonadota bacterium]
MVRIPSSSSLPTGTAGASTKAIRDPAPLDDGAGTSSGTTPRKKQSDGVDPGSQQASRIAGSDQVLPSHTRPEQRPGARAQVDLTGWQPEALKKTLLADIERAFTLLRQLPPAVTFFGGARIKPDDPFYELSKAIGRRLAASGIPPRTGAGPGIMTSVPQGYKEAKGHPQTGNAVYFAPVLEGFSEQASRDDTRTQGFNILLPHEQGLNDAIDTATELVMFPYRKLALYENVRGLVTFPGGFGTLDELFEVWSLAVRGRHSDPMAVIGKTFWQPLLDTIEQVAVRDRQLLDPAQLSLIQVTDDPDELVSYLASDHEVRGFEHDPVQSAMRMSAEISDAIDLLDRLPEAVTFIGGHRLDPADPACKVAEHLAQVLQRDGQALRVGGAGPTARAVTAGALAADPDARVQGFLLSDEDGGKALPGLEVHKIFDEPVTHRAVIGSRCKAFVALPGGVGTLDELFTVLCQVQTGKMKKMPIVLIGSDYWQPILDAIRRSMLSGERQTIAPGDLDLVTVTDDAAAAARLIRGG